VKNQIAIRKKRVSQMHIQADHRSPANASRALDEQISGVRIADRFGFVAMEQPVVHVAFTTAMGVEKGALAHGIGRTKGGRNTKLHAVCDEKGRPCVLLLTPGNVLDCKVAQRCIEAMPPSTELVAV
jgi:hypothetical protein